MTRISLFISVCAVAVAQTQTDRLLVGSMTVSNFANVGKLPLPAFQNQKICSTVSLAPNAEVWAYVPTAAERNGNFSAFSGQLIDPVTNQPFPGGLIPLNRLPSVFAWRLAPAPAAPGEPCVNPQLLNSIFFSTANYITGRTSGDAIFAGSSFIPLAYTLGSTPPSTQVKLGSFGSSPLSFITAIRNGDQFAPITNLSLEAVPCCTTPSTLNIGIRPANLTPGVYQSTVNVTPINTIARPVAIGVQLTVTAPASWVTTNPSVVDFPSYTLSNSTVPSILPPPQTIQITSLGAARSFTIRSQSTVPPGVNWFTVTPSSGNAIGTLTITLNTAVLNKLGRGKYTGFFDITAPGAPNSPLRIMVFATVFPGTDFTLSPDEIGFSFNLGDPAPAPQTVTVDPVAPAQGTTTLLSFAPYITMADARDPVWLKAAPNATGLPGRVSVSLDSTVLSSLSAGDHVAYLSLNSAATATGVDPPASNTAQRVTAKLTVSGEAPVTATTTQVLSQIADGGGWQTKIVLINTDLVNAAPISLRFWPGQDTPAILVPILTTGPLNDFTLRDTIPPGGSRTYRTQGSANPPLWQGWGELTAPPTVGGTAVFRHSTTSNQDNEGAVPLKIPEGNRFVLPFDCSGTATEQFVTSMAIINAAPDQTANILVTAADVAGASIVLPAANANFPMLPRAHSAFDVCGRFPALGGKRGALVFTTPAGQISGLGLRFNPRNAFTSIGTMAASSGSTTKRIAHIADGGNWRTEIVILNLDSVDAGVTVRFNRSTLTSNIPLTLANPGLNGSVFTTPAQSPIPRNGSLWISTQGTSSQLWQGWAEVTSNANINGFAIFRQRVSATADSEGAVPFTSPGGVRFLMPFDNTGGFVTSMAIVSPDAATGQIRGVFRNSEGTPILTGASMLSLLGHTAFALTDQLPFNVGGSGVADFTTTGTEMFGIGLLFNPRSSFTSLPLQKTGL